jgi:GTP-binding protein HflX
VLDEVGAGATPQLMVYNKIDIGGFEARVDLDDRDQPWRIWLSAISGEGFDRLRETLQQRFGEQTALYQMVLRAGEGQIRAYLFENGCIESENYAENGDIHLKLRLSPALLKRLVRRFDIAADRVSILADALAGAA